MAWDYDALHKAPHSYFDAVDAQDVEAIVAHFADDATQDQIDQNGQVAFR